MRHVNSRLSLLEQQTFATNISGVLNGIYTFLPLFKASTQSPSAGHKAIVITGSKQGITNPPLGRNPAYNASKAALKSLAEHLSHDLRSDSATKNISVHLLVPGWTYTSLSGNRGGPIPDEEALATKPKGAWLPSQVAEYMYKKMEEGQFYIVCPDDDVGEPMDKARMTWAMGDVTMGRPALSRWDENWKDKASEWISNEAAKLAGESK
jgi:NAD(P)-dependent dehydrogenase (short-subunit alcohol dehydrogenase family)